MHIEYAITSGKGILLDYGVVDRMIKMHEMLVTSNRDEHTLITRPCSQDCQTGK